jgi:hypothetical protein
MSLSKDQRKDLGRLSEYFKKIEKIAVENNIDLDVFMSEYKDDGFAFYATEKIGINPDAGQRKKIFEKEGKDKSVRSHSKK